MRILKRAPKDIAPRATIAKFQGMKTLLNAIGREIDRQLPKEGEDPNDAGFTWAHFGDARRFYAELRELADIMQLPSNDVREEHACPECGERDADWLEILDDRVRCAVCECEYEM